jgi:hypothetical protein
MTRPPAQAAAGQQARQLVGFLTRLCRLEVTLQPPQAINQRVVGELDRLGQREPSHLLALTRWRRRVIVVGLEHVAQVKVEVRSGRVGVEVQQHRSTGRVAHGETGFLARLAQRGGPRCLARVQMTARLQPAPEALVPVQDRPSATGHECGAGDVDRIILPAERIGEPVKLREEPGPGRHLPLGGGVEGDHRFPHLSGDVVALSLGLSVHIRHHARYRGICGNAVGKDCMVSWRTLATVGAALVAALMTGCATTAAAPPGQTRLVSSARSAISTPSPKSDSCYAFAVSALRRHVVVRRRPPACADIPQAQVNEDVARAIRTVVGPHPKAIQRQLAVANSRYLESLVRPVRPPPPVSIAETAQPSSGNLALRFSALAAWLLGWLTRDQRRHLFRQRRVLGVVPLIHAGLAIAGLLVWIAFTVTNVAALAWAGVGLTWIIAGLGMATLLGGLTEQADVPASSTAAGEEREVSTTPVAARAPVIVIAVHGALATLTILLVLLAAVGAG